MDESDGAAGERANGEASGGRTVEFSGEETLPWVLRSFVDGVCSPGAGREPLLGRLRVASRESAPRLREASRNSARDLLAWTRRGSGLRAILVISVGTITLIALTGLLIFMFFLLVATANAIIVSVLMSLAAAGGFLAMFFAFLVVVYNRSSISCCFCHFCHGYLSNCWSDDCYWLGWILLDDLVCCKEEHGPYKALNRHDKFGNPIIFHFVACEAESYRLRRAVIQFQLIYCGVIIFPHRSAVTLCAI